MRAKVHHARFRTIADLDIGKLNQLPGLDVAQRNGVDATCNERVPTYLCVNRFLRSWCTGGDDNPRLRSHAYRDSLNVSPNDRHQIFTSASCGPCLTSSTVDSNIHEQCPDRAETPRSWERLSGSVPSLPMPPGCSDHTQGCVAN